MMGLLRAASDAVIVGAGTLRSVPNHVWTPDHVAPSFAGEFRRLRDQLKKSRQPLNVIVTAAGNLDPTLPVFQRGEAPVLIATTREGARKIAAMSMPASVQIAILADEGPLRPSVIRNRVSDACGGADRILVEGGPQLLGGFLAEGQLDELFLTVAPQVAGRSNDTARPGVVSGQSFAPDRPVWATLVSVKRAGSALFLRYSFSARANSSERRITNVQKVGEPT
jgi:riboflavin biosynthesis pyrimidine reductase